MNRIAKYLFTLLISISVFLIGVNYVNAESSAGEILLSKTASKKDLEKGRSADVTLTVNANGFTTVDKTDVVLVLDRSSSMNGTPMENTKTAAKDLIELLITDKTKAKTRAAIVTYGSDLLPSHTSNSLTNDATALKSTIDSIPRSIFNQGTNVHAGLLKAEKLLGSSGTDTQKIIILLSDGGPTLYLGSENMLCGTGKSDRPDDSKGCTVNGNNRPSTVANAEATTIKNSGTKIYTVGFTSGADMTFLGNIASNPTEKYSYTASDYEGLKETFKKINAKYGKYSVIGNHDYSIDIEKIRNIYKESDFILLENNYDFIYSKNNQKIFIGGISTGEFNESVLSKLTNEENIYKIIIMHEPDYIDSIKGLKPNIVMAGHSHNGQINIPYIKNFFLPTNAKKYYDKYYKVDNIDLYVSNGIGVSRVNFRLFNTPSINFYRINKK